MAEQEQKQREEGKRQQEEERQWPEEACIVFAADATQSVTTNCTV